MLKTVTGFSVTLTTGQTRMVLIWKLIEYTGLVLFIVIVPRLMGPDRYGSFAALLSLVALLSAASGLGGRPTFGRYLPEYAVRGETGNVQALFVQFFCARALVASLLGVVFLFLFPRVLPETSSLTVAAGAGSLFFGVLAVTCYDLFYGLNDLGKWLSQQSLTKILLLIVLVILGGGHSLDRASLALLVTQLGFLLFGLYWTRSYFAFRKSTFHISTLLSSLRFGLLFFATQLLLMAVWQGGEVVVLLFSGQSAEVAFFSLANAIALAFAALIGQLVSMIIPSLTAFHFSGEEDRKNSLMGHFLKYLTIASFCFLFVVHTLGPWAIETALGEQYLPVVPNLKVLVFGLLPTALVSTGLSWAAVHTQPGKALRMSVVTLATFLVAAAVLVPNTGSFGASVAMSLATVSGGVLVYYQFPLAQVLAVARFWRLILLGFVALGVLVLPATMPISMGLLAMILYLSLIFLTKVITFSEIRQISQALVT